MNKGTRPLIAVIRGGYSGESVISHQSAKCMMDAIDKERVDPVYITISREAWSCSDPFEKTLSLDRSEMAVVRGNERSRISAALIAIHGSPGEDGKLQGFLDMLNIPYQTGDALNMAVTFSKFTTTALLREMGFTVAPSVMAMREMADAVERAKTVGLPCFVKPDQSGSSLGVTKVKNIEGLLPALEAAFAECASVMIEGAVVGRELTCGVMDLDGRIIALPICEIRTSHEFFDYEAKYHAQDTEELIPAPLPEHITRLVQERSVSIYTAMNCRGLVRVDHFWTGGDDQASVVTIELNTVPGFSSASIFPKMLRVAGTSAAVAINGMIEKMILT